MMARPRGSFQSNSKKHRGARGLQNNNNKNKNTEVPSLMPSAEPSKTPTRLPSRSPTYLPTRTPTKSPTKAPTTTPTSAPTENPTRAPTRVPTRTPTTRAPTTGAPTKTPTRAPTRAPTTRAPTTRAPTTRVPTKSPTKSPTEVPTKSPTKAPTNSPTEVPTKTPTTLSPTRLPYLHDTSSHIVGNLNLLFSLHTSPTTTSLDVQEAALVEVLNDALLCTTGARLVTADFENACPPLSPSNRLLLLEEEEDSTNSTSPTPWRDDLTWKDDLSGADGGGVTVLWNVPAVQATWYWLVVDEDGESTSTVVSSTRKQNQTTISTTNTTTLLEYLQWNFSYRVLDYGPQSQVLARGFLDESIITGRMDVALNSKWSASSTTTTTTTRTSLIGSELEFLWAPLQQGKQQSGVGAPSGILPYKSAEMILRFIGAALIIGSVVAFTALTILARRYRNRPNHHQVPRKLVVNREKNQNQNQNQKKDDAALQHPPNEEDTQMMPKTCATDDDPHSQEADPMEPALGSVNTSSSSSAQDEQSLLSTTGSGQQFEGEVLEEDPLEAALGHVAAANNAQRKTSSLPRRPSCQKSDMSDDQDSEEE